VVETCSERPLTDNIGMLVQLDAETSGAASLSLGGSFESAIAVPGAANPVAFRLSAAVVLETGSGIKPPDATLVIGGAMLSPLHLDAIPFITIQYLTCEATLGKGPTGISLNALSLTFKQQLFGADMEGLFAFDARTGKLILMATLENLDLETAINSFGYNVHLGPLSLTLQGAHVRYAQLNNAVGQSCRKLVDEHACNLFVELKFE
jgi:hypothetical protein